MNGFKFLDPTGATYYDGVETVYPLPQPGEKWGAEFVHPNPGKPDGRDCGPGGWHVMKKPDARYAPDSWWPWYVKDTGVLLGTSPEKFRTTSLCLRRISPKAWHRMIRLGWCQRAYLRGAFLQRAYLRGADLQRAFLQGAYLRGADLRGADLREANLREAKYDKDTTRWPVGFDYEKAVQEVE